MNHTPYRLTLLLKTLIACICSILLPSASFSDVYIAGGDEYTIPSQAYLWIVDAGYNVEQITLPGSDATAQCVALSRSQVYVGGDVGDSPCLWITDLDGSNPELLTLSLPQSGSSIYGIAVANSQVYMAATVDESSEAYLVITNLDGTNLRYVRLPEGSNAVSVAANASYVYVATDDSLLWICNASDGSLVNTVDLGQGGGENRKESNIGIALANNSVYISGGPNLDYNITNIDGSNLRIITPGGVGSGAFYNGIAVDSQIYIAVDDYIDNNPPEVLIANLAGNSFQYVPLADEVGTATDLIVTSSQIYTIGYIRNFPLIPAYLWVTGLDGSNVQSIVLNDSANAYGIATLPTTVNPLWSAFQLYNPRKLLKGLAP